MNTEKNTRKEAILTRLRESKCTPRARWCFVLERLALFIPGILAVFTGALSVSVAIFSLSNAGWRFYRVTHDSLFGFSLEALPYLWILLTALFVGIAIYQLRKTDRGYRYHVPSLLLLSLLLSVLLGILTFMLGVGAKVDSFAGHMAPAHKGVLSHLEDTWLAPDEGRLLGVLVESQDTWAVLIDLRGERWSLDMRQVFVRADVPIDGDVLVRVLGIPSTNRGDVFTVCALFPMHGRGVSPERPLREVSVLRRIALDSLGQVMPRIESERNISHVRTRECRDLLELLPEKIRGERLHALPIN
ncbi:MAG: hypothetical protein ACI83D_000701 [Planctomycetota bacterium]|jgi:hypothetical protein